MSDEYNKAEYDEEGRAFRDGLRQAADAEDFEGIDPADLRPANGRRFNWPAAVGGAAAVAAVVLLAVFIAPRAGIMAAGSAAVPASGAVPEAAPSAGSAPGDSGVTPASLPGPDEEDAASTPAVQPPAASGGSGPGDPLPGFRWESFRDVVVQVPESWGYEFAPGPDWCASFEGAPEPKAPSAPFVDIRRGGPTMAILCSENVPAERLAMNLQFWDADYEGPALQSPWTYRTVTLGDTTVAVATDGSEPGLVQQILDSARQAEVDQNGCPAAIPEPATANLAALKGAPIAVCDYAGNPDPRLQASATLRGEALDAAWQAILAAPAGGGPDSPASECLPGTPAPTVMVLLVDGRSIRFEYGGCTGNGLADSGVSSGMRTVTKDLCGALFVPPTRFSSGLGKAGQVCLAGTSR